MTGLLKFSVVKGDNVDFEADQTIYKKIVEVEEPKRIDKKERKKKEEFKL